MQSKEISEREKMLVNFFVTQETLLHLSMITNDKDLIFEWNKYAEGLVQKTNLQLMTVRKIFKQSKWHSTLDNKDYNYIIDPLSLAAAIRGAYECMLTLNHIFVNPPNQDETQIRYLLWALSTFISKDQAKPALSEEGKVKREGIRKDIENTVDHLLTLDLVNSLDEPSKKLIKSKSAPRAGDRWEYYIDGSKLERINGGWHGLAERMPAREHVFDNLYKLFSINSHPTWHSINIVVHAFEFGEEEPENFRMMDTMLSMSAMIGVFIIYDYCSLFKEVKEAFLQLPPQMQEIINTLLVIFKGDDYRLTK